MRSLKASFAYGLFLIPAWFAALFALSLIYSSEQPMDFLSANVIAAAAVGLVAFFLGRRVGLVSPRYALLVGTSWNILVILVMFVVGFGNDTLGIIFGTWSMYLTYVAVEVGAVLAVTKPKSTAAVL